MKLFKNQTTGDIFQSDNPNQPENCVDITTASEGADYFLQKAKEAKTAEIRAIKETELYKAVSYMGKVFAASERASGNITASLVLNGETVNWLDNDGNPVSMTRAEFQGLGIAIKNQRSLVYFKESQKYQEIAAASTIEQVNAITW